MTEDVEVLKERIKYLEKQNKSLIEEVNKMNELKIEHAKENCPTLIGKDVEDFPKYPELPPNNTITIPRQEVVNYKYRYFLLVKSINYKIERKEDERRWINNLQKEMNMYLDMIKR
jgi:hypothetical protein